LLQDLDQVRTALRQDLTYAGAPPVLRARVMCALDQEDGDHQQRDHHRQEAAASMIATAVCATRMPTVVDSAPALAANSAMNVLAYWHQPRFSSGFHGSDATYQPFWQALYEGVAYDAEGQLLTASYQDYCLPRADDIPPIEVHFVGEPDFAFNPIGARGIGEIGITGIAAAVANAVYHAIGKRVRDLPITPDKLI